MCRDWCYRILPYKCVFLIWVTIMDSLLFSRRLQALFVFPVFLVFALRATTAQSQAPQGFTALFNGKDLAGWHGMVFQDPEKLAAQTDNERKSQVEKWTAEAMQHWKVANGEIVSDGKGAYLTTDADHGDVELLIECKTASKAGSAILLRGTPINLASMPPGQWNSIRILVVGERITAYIDGKLAVDHARLENVWKPAFPLAKQGQIQLKSQEGEVRWRNAFIRPIVAAEANEILRKHSNVGFVDVFNGKDFTGWAGPIDQYEVKDGAIVCRPKKGGTIYTKDEYADFVARVEFLLPPAGNNGLAIRYPGKGDTAYVGMCEIQVLDDTAPTYAKLDKRQYNGSAYGMVPAHRGYLRPVGQWNFEEVTIKGSTIRVELNGTVILDTDLSKVTEYMANKAHPGKDRTSGHFGFAGHNDPVAFRNIQIKKLDAK
jgi:hypothetical protein